MSDTPFRFDIVSLFPELVEGYLGGSIIGRAQKSALIDVNITNPRDFTSDRHRTVDDSPYGGGAGMVMMPEPLGQAIDCVRATRGPARVVLLSPSGRPFTQTIVEEYAQLGSIALICGRYEGIDARIGDHLVDEALSIGDYVLTGGELAALTVIDAVSRQLPGVLGNAQGALEESFAGQALLEHPQYTRPREWRGHAVPDVLLSGNHAEIERWRSEQRLLKTAHHRPDLFERWCTDNPESAGAAREAMERNK